jgi:GlpG protein
MLHGHRNMRVIGRLNSESNAKILGDYLTCLDIRNSVEPEQDGQWAVWVFSEDQLEAGNQALTEFVANPNDPKFRRASAKAGAIRQREEREKSEFAKRVLTPDTMWGGYGLGPLTVALMGACIALALVAGFPPVDAVRLADEPFYRHLYMTLLKSEFGFLPEVRHGEVWRLITPIFIHMGLPHLLFNMLWLKGLGSMIEARQGTFKLLLVVLVIGVGSNLGQDLVGGPAFGGMSGVLYGLFGFIWMRGKLDPASGLRLNQADVVMMVGWFFLCLFHIIPHVANGAHGVGLAMGMIWGAAPPLAKKFLKL